MTVTLDYSESDRAVLNTYNLFPASYPIYPPSYHPLPSQYWNEETGLVVVDEARDLGLDAFGNLVSLTPRSDRVFYGYDEARNDLILEEISKYPGTLTFKSGFASVRIDGVEAPSFDLSLPLADFDKTEDWANAVHDRFIQDIVSLSDIRLEDTSGVMGVGVLDPEDFRINLVQRVRATWTESDMTLGDLVVPDQYYSGFEIGARYTPFDGENVIVVLTESNDQFSGDIGHDLTIESGAGDDSISLSFPTKISNGAENGAPNEHGRNLRVDLGEGSDVLDVSTLGANQATVLGGSGNDRIEIGSRDAWTGQAQASVFTSGGTGHDIVTLGRLSPGQANGDTGNDTLTGSLWSDTLRGGDDDDVLIGIGGHDTLIGGAGDDTYNFTIFGDWFVAPGTPGVAGSGEFLIQDVGGTLALEFFNGFAPAKFERSEENLLVDIGPTIIVIEDYYLDPLAWNAVRITGSKSAPLTAFFDPAPQLAPAFRGTDGDDRLAGAATEDALYGKTGDDLIFAYDGNDTLGGGAGHDSLSGGNGADQIWGARGNDALFGDGGHDTLGGGEGDDVLSGGWGADALWGATGNDTLNGDEGHDTLGGYAGDDVVFGGSGNDEIWGATGDDTLSGDGGSDRIGGGDGDDLVHGGGGKNQLSGGRGNDTISAKDGDDTIYGFDGDDVITSGRGDDRIFGGEGADTFIYTASDTGSDEIHGFDPAQQDVLQIAADLLPGLRNLEASDIVERVTWIDDGGNTVFSYDGGRIAFVGLSNPADIAGTLEMI